MRARQLASQWIAVRPVTFLAGAGLKIDGATHGIDEANTVAFSVGQINLSIRADTQALGAGKRRQLCRAAIAGETLLAGAGNVVDCLSFQIQLVDRVSLAQGKPQISVTIEI